MHPLININQRAIGDHQPCYIIAEAGVNHNGDTQLALELVEKAYEVGADCVKFQTFTAESVITKQAPKAHYQLQVTDHRESQFEMLRKLELSQDAYQSIIHRCQTLGIQFLSTPYSAPDADFLHELEVPAFKVASGQLVELSFLEHLAAFHKPIILSTGMATLAEVYDAVATIRAFHDQFFVLQCTTNYPSRLEDANIRAMVAMREALNVPVGYSDHVESNYACYAAVAQGACIIEKHFTLDRALPGPDHKASLDIAGFRELVAGIRAVEASLGSSVKTPTQAERDNTEGMRRSIVTVRPIQKGETLETSALSFKRPATGLPPRALRDIIGKKAAKDLAEDEVLQPNAIVW